MGVEVKIDDLTFRSNFDSGNLARVEKHVRQPSFVDENGDPSPPYDEYNCWTSPDCAGTEFENGNRTWFYFAVDGGTKGRTIRINIMNMNRQGKLYSQGMVPVVKVVPGSDGWERMSERPSFVLTDTSMRLSFYYTFERDSISTDHVTTYFAFCFPYSYEDCQRYLEAIDGRFSEESEGVEVTPTSIYYHRDLLCRSLDGRRVDVLTISSHEGLLDAHEPVIENGFPDGQDTRANQFEGKKYFFISARIHPGETPASHVLRGFVEFLLDEDDARAAELRRRFVFVIVPMLNPDGVFRGHYRTDQRGVNLNRVYDNPDVHTHPSVYGVKHLLRSIASRYTLQYYVDLHGHAVKRGCFIYGNSLDVVSQIDNILYPRLISLHSPHFDFEACNFSEKNMVARDKKDGLSKEGSGRVSMLKDLGVAQSYTLECNYNCGRMTNSIPPATGEEGRSTPAGQFGPPTFFTEESFKGVGRALLHAALELENANPYSRIPRSEHPTLADWRRWAEGYVRSSLPYRMMPTVTRMGPIIRADGTRAEPDEKRPSFGTRRTTIGEGLIASRQNSRTQLEKTAVAGAGATKLPTTHDGVSRDTARFLTRRAERLVRTVSDNRMVVGKSVVSADGEQLPKDVPATVLASHREIDVRTPSTRSVPSSASNLVRGITGKPAAGPKPSGRETSLAGGPLQKHMVGFEGVRPLKKPAAVTGHAGGTSGVTASIEARPPTRVAREKGVEPWSVAGHHVDPLVKIEQPAKKFVAPSPTRVNHQGPRSPQPQPTLPKPNPAGPKEVSTSRTSGRGAGAGHTGAASRKSAVGRGIALPPTQSTASATTSSGAKGVAVTRKTSTVAAAKNVAMKSRTSKVGPVSAVAAEVPVDSTSSPVDGVHGSRETIYLDEGATGRADDGGSALVDGDGDSGFAWPPMGAGDGDDDEDRPFVWDESGAEDNDAEQEPHAPSDDAKSASPSSRSSSRPASAADELQEAAGE